jgi:hypothetical protein
VDAIKSCGQGSVRSSPDRDSTRLTGFFACSGISGGCWRRQAARKIDRRWLVSLKVRSGRLCRPHIHHMDIGAEAHVVREIEARIVRVVVDDDVVAVPDPVGGIRNIRGRNLPQRTLEPEASRCASYEAIHEARDNAEREPAMFPWMIEVEALIVSRGKADPRIVAMHVRRFRVVRHVAHVAPFLRLIAALWWCDMLISRLWPAAGDVSSPGGFVAALRLLPLRLLVLRLRMLALRRLLTRPRLVGLALGLRERRHRAAQQKHGQQ